MPQSLAEIYLHLVFSTKNRIPFLRDETFRNEMHAYISGTCRNLDAPSLIIGGVEEHVHILCRLGRTITVANLVKEIKKASSKWAKLKDQNVIDFGWQAGYGAFSISPSHVPALQNYISNQEEHHRHESFQDEYRRLLKKYGMAFDEKYVWD